jgi:hypothetical protein
MAPSPFSGKSLPTAKALTPEDRHSKEFFSTLKIEIIEFVAIFQFILQKKCFNS